MVFVMDKMKDQSCAIQPAFGIGGGGGFNGLNFALMFDQVFNPDVIPISDDDDDAQLDAAVNIPPFNITNFPPLPFSPINFPTVNFNPFTNTQLLPLTTEQSNQQSNQATGTQQQQPTVAELVTNAIQHHLATHHALLNNTSGTAANGTNNVQPPQSMVQHITSPHVPPLPPDVSEVVHQSVNYQILSDVLGSVPNTVHADQPQLLISLPLNNGAGLQYVGWQPPPDFSLDIQFSTNPDQQQPASPESAETSPNFILNNAQETVPTDEDSNLSETLVVQSLQAPFSSAAYPLSFSELGIPSEYEDQISESDIVIIASGENSAIAASDIVIIDSSENSMDADENLSNHTNVPN